MSLHVYMVYFRLWMKGDKYSGCTMLWDNIIFYKANAYQNTPQTFIIIIRWSHLSRGYNTYTSNIYIYRDTQW